MYCTHSVQPDQWPQRLQWFTLTFTFNSRYGFLFQTALFSITIINHHLNGMMSYCATNQLIITSHLCGNSILNSRFKWFIYRLQHFNEVLRVNTGSFNLIMNKNQQTYFDTNEGIKEMWLIIRIWYIIRQTA